MSELGILGLHHVAIADHGEGAVRERLVSLFQLGEAHREIADGFDEYLLPVGESCIQTIEVNGPGTVQRFVDKRGPGLHHVAFGVADIAAALDELRRRGVRLIDDQARPGGNGTMIAFLHPSSCGGVLIELVQDS